MLSQLFLGISLLGAEWVLYLLVALSVVSVALIGERLHFYRKANQGLAEFRAQVRAAAAQGQWQEALRLAEMRTIQSGQGPLDLEGGVVLALLRQTRPDTAPPAIEVLNELAQDQIVRAKIRWDQNLALLATIGSNAPFVGLFGTVLGIIQAFHDLSRQQAQGVTTVTAGLAEALVATAVGILVAIPAVVAFNLFQRQVRQAVAQAEALKSFLVGHLMRGKMQGEA